ncbi:hypothetical protein D3C86_1906500 [compost metagenome]
MAFRETLSQRLTVALPERRRPMAPYRWAPVWHITDHLDFQWPDVDAPLALAGQSVSAATRRLLRSRVARWWGGVADCGGDQTLRPNRNPGP